MVKSIATNVGSATRWPKGGTVPGANPACTSVSSRVARRTRLLATPRRRAIFLWSTRAVPLVTHTAKAPSQHRTMLFTIRSTATPSASALDWTSGVFAGHRTSSTFGASLAAIHARRFSDVIASLPGGSRGGDWSSEASTAAVPRRGARCLDRPPPMAFTRCGVIRGARAHTDDAAKTREEGEGMHRVDDRAPSPERGARGDETASDKTARHVTHSVSALFDRRKRAVALPSPTRRRCRPSRSRARRRLSRADASRAPRRARQPCEPRPPAAPSMTTRALHRTLPPRPHPSAGGRRCWPPRRR